MDEHHYSAVPQDPEKYASPLYTHFEDDEKTIMADADESITIDDIELTELQMTPQPKPAAEKSWRTQLGELEVKWLGCSVNFLSACIMLVCLLVVVFKFKGNFCEDDGAKFAISFICAWTCDAVTKYHMKDVAEHRKVAVGALCLATSCVVGYLLYLSCQRCSCTIIPLYSSYASTDAS